MNFIKSVLEFSNAQGTQDVASLVKSAKAANVNKQDTRGFALENEDGSLVKIYVKSDQAEEFEAALSKALYDAEEDGVEVPEMLFNLRQQFDIVDVEWGEKSIPEDEEEDIKLDKSDDNDNTDDADEENDDDTSEDNLDDETDMDALDADAGMSDDDVGTDDLSSIGGDQPNSAQEDLLGAITKVMDMLKSKAEAEKAEANAKKAEAEVKMAQEANKAASLRAAQEEEVLDMEDHNKRKDEEKKMSDTRDKLIKYRHDVKNKNSGDSQIGESMDHTKKYPEATPEEEELLHAQDWKDKDAERKKRAKERELLVKFRHERKKRQQRRSMKRAVEGVGADAIQKIRNITFSKFNVLVEKQLTEAK